MTELYPEEIREWERGANEAKAWAEQVHPERPRKPAYRAIDQDPRTVFLSVYGQDTRPDDWRSYVPSRSVETLRTKTGTIR